MDSKRILGIFTAIVLAAGLTAGCGKTETAPQEAQSSSAETEQASEEEESTEEESGQEESEAGEAETETGQAEAETGETAEEIPEEETAAVESFPETVLFDRDGV